MAYIARSCSLRTYILLKTFKIFTGICDEFQKYGLCFLQELAVK